MTEEELKQISWQYGEDYHIDDAHIKYHADKSFYNGATSDAAKQYWEEKGWIRVIDKPPVFNSTIFFYSSKYNMVRMGRVDRGAMVHNGSRYILGTDVTHWRELPTPPITEG